MAGRERGRSVDRKHSASRGGTSSGIRPQARDLWANSPAANRNGAVSGAGTLVSRLYPARPEIFIDQTSHASELSGLTSRRSSRSAFRSAHAVISLATSPADPVLAFSSPRSTGRDRATTRQKAR